MRHLLHFVLTFALVSFGLLSNSMRLTGQFPCPPCGPCGGCKKCAAADVVNIATAMAVKGKLQIDATGTYTVGGAGKNRKLKEINIVCEDQKGNKTRIQAGTDNNGGWSVPMGVLPAGTYDVSAEITTTDNCGGNQMKTPSDPKQTIEGVVIKSCCTESLDVEDLLVYCLFMRSAAARRYYFDRKVGQVFQPAFGVPPGWKT